MSLLVFDTSRGFEKYVDLTWLVAVEPGDVQGLLSAALSVSLLEEGDTSVIHVPMSGLLGRSW